MEEVAGFAHEGQRDEIHAEFQAEFHVLDVLGGERGQADFDAGQIDVAAAAEFALGEDLAFHLVAVLGEHFHFDRAVVDEHDVADADVVDEIVVVHIHGMFLLAVFAADGEGEFLSGLEVQRDAKSPVRMAGPWVSIRMPMCAARGGSARMSLNTRRTQSCGAWDMFRRKTLTPASMSLPIMSAESVAGPSVETILVVRNGASFAWAQE